MNKVKVMVVKIVIQIIKCVIEIVVDNWTIGCLTLCDLRNACTGTCRRGSYKSWMV